MSRRKLPILMEQAIGAVRAEAIQKAQSFEMQVRLQRDPTCRPGCTSCCYYPLEISVLEAVPIYKELAQAGRWTPAFVQSLKEHADKTLMLRAQIWMLTQIACPLLKDKRCSIYEVRPFACRTTWATADPFYCNGQNFGPQTSLVPKDDLMRDFQEYEVSISKQAGLAHYTMPISQAILLAERLVSGDLDFNEVLTDLISRL